MRLSIKLAFILISAVVLTACKQKSDTDYYDYLMQHPNKLRTQLTDCQLMSSDQERGNVRCSIVYRAGNDMMALIELQQKNPEKFGLYILQAQMSLAAAEDILQKQLDAYSQMRNSNASTEAMQAAMLEIQTSMHKKREIIRDIQAKLAVVSLSSPE